MYQQRGSRRWRSQSTSADLPEKYVIDCPCRNKEPKSQYEGANLAGFLPNLPAAPCRGEGSDHFDSLRLCVKQLIPKKKCPTLSSLSKTCDPCPPGASLHVCMPAPFALESSRSLRGPRSVPKCPGTQSLERPVTSSDGASLSPSPTLSLPTSWIVRLFDDYVTGSETTHPPPDGARKSRLGSGHLETSHDRWFTLLVPAKVV